MSRQLTSRLQSWFPRDGCPSARERVLSNPANTPSLDATDGGWPRAHARVLRSNWGPPQPPTKADKVRRSSLASRSSCCRSSAGRCTVSRSLTVIWWLYRKRSEQSFPLHSEAARMPTNLASQVSGQASLTEDGPARTRAYCAVTVSVPREIRFNPAIHRRSGHRCYPKAG
jgi:hypothetical protein